jgi:hypothetical protein
MLEHHLYSEPFPLLDDDFNEEFKTLTQYLGLRTLSSNNHSENDLIIKSLNWTCEQPIKLIQTWCQDYINFASKSLIAARVGHYSLLFIYLKIIILIIH